MNNAPQRDDTRAIVWPGADAPQSASHDTATSALQNRVIRNTYALLAMTLLFSAGVATAAMALQLPSPGIIITLVGFFALLFAVHKLQNSAWALAAVFGLTGFMGGFLFAGMVIALLAGIAATLFEIPALGMAMSAMVALLSAGLILFETSRIVNGGETNYVLATVGLFVSLFNLFTSLLSLFGFGSSGD